MALSSAIGAATLGLAAPGADAVVAIGVEHGVTAFGENYELIKVVSKAASHVVLHGIGEAVDEVYAKTAQSKESKKTR